MIWQNFHFLPTPPFLIIFIHSWIDVEGRHRQPDIWEYKHLKEIELNVEEILFPAVNHQIILHVI